MVLIDVFTMRVLDPSRARAGCLVSGEIQEV